MTSVRLDIEYDGSGFSGWARQPGVRTVQGELEAAVLTALRRPATLAVAGRTDTGVHALGQVASFDTDAELPPELARRLNGITDRDIAVIGAGAVADGFDARRDAVSRTYRYRLLARGPSSPFELDRALWWPQPLDRAALDACAEALLGTHDFTAFTPTETEHVRFRRRVFAAGWEWQGGHGAFVVTADAFMRNMVRVLVGTQIEVAMNQRTLENFTTLLQGAPRSAAGETAPPHGLYLESVSYP